MNTDQRKHVWGHNGLRGSAKMVEKILYNIERSPSTTQKAKDLAVRMLNQCHFLHEALIERVDPKGLFK